MPRVLVEDVDTALLPSALCSSRSCISRLADLEPPWVNLTFTPRIDWLHGARRGDCVVGEIDYIVHKYCSPEHTNETPADGPSEERLRLADVHSAMLPQSSFAQLASLLPNKTLVVMGDSVMEQAYNALQCFLRRESLELPVDGAFSDFIAANRPLWMMGKRKMAPKLPQRAITGRGTAPMRLLFARAVKYMAEDVRAALQTADVLILNWGLHYHDMTEFRADLEAACDLFDAFLNDKAHGRERAVLLRETGAQHFRGVTGGGGEYDLRDKTRDAGQCECNPIEDYNVNRPNTILREVVAERRAAGSRIRILPFYTLTRPRWRWHFGNCTNRPTGWGGSQCCDCTHWCWSPGFWQAHMHDMVLGLRHSLGGPRDCEQNERTSAVPCT